MRKNKASYNKHKKKVPGTRIRKKNGSTPLGTALWISSSDPKERKHGKVKIFTKEEIEKYIEEHSNTHNGNLNDRLDSKGT